MRHTPIDAARLREVFHYDPATGVFTRLVSTSSRTKVGSIAGCVGHYGYVHIGLDGSRYRANRLAYVYMHGSIPDGMWIDHINGDRADNRICNLRAATPSQNGQNQGGSHADSSTGVKGVYFHKGAQKYTAMITTNRQTTYLGLFGSVEEAIAARAAAERALHPFSPLNAPKPSIGDAAHG